MLYVDDKLVTHPKILKAGDLVGLGGASRALHLYLLGISYARANLTDGFLPRKFVESCGVVSRSSLVAKALSARGIGLWRKVKGGYVIHDYHHWNPKASAVKEKREHDRQRKALERGGRSSNLSTLDTSRTRARAFLKTTSTTKSTSTDAPRRSGILHPVENPSFALACVVMREAIDQARTVDHDTGLATAGEYFKTFCAHRGLAYDGDLVRRTYDAVTGSQRRRA